ncbi:S-locus lectin protein kinase family protein [Arabidopsis thaliana]|uniref:Receptor-like serine/threonine-protein kinase n=1 Tax=Arabidopsis thaliana TaxID=3702 RepID=A0A1P8ARD8_ARATH|nr:S-locus lectin protein kinase family protein [Arabidopsis thaliana]ANM59226.1 S-locus lectin protein kinase family protein [Arabidopsis thaliana]|eukprot:NP_001321603.1 S-locus lectin protein kinase family protein [Arabidopsis thaliana]
MAGFNRNLTLVTTLLIFHQLCSNVSCSTSNSFTRNHTIREGDSLISEDESFELGFFTPKNSTLRYVGIWYKNIEPQTVVWVANREKPLLDHKGALKIADDGNLVIVNGQNETIWSTNVEPESNNTVAVLFKTGDLVLCSDSDRRKWYWESFNNPTDTFLPGMRVRVNPSLGENRAFIPWKSESDPSPGKYSMGIDPVGALEIVIWEGEKRKWRSGPWNSAIFTGIPDMLRFTNYIYGFKLSSPPDRDGSVYFTYVASDSSDFLRFWIRPDGVEEQFRWNKDIRNWNLLQWKPSTECEKYNRCGNYSVCDDSKEFDSGKCSCIDGFEPVHQDQWNNRDFSGGCQRRVPLNCNQSLVAGQEDGFTVLKGIKVPDFGSVVLHNNSETCKDVCARDCSCKAYALVVGIGCMIWTRDLIDMEHFERGGNSINIRLAGSKLGGGKENSTLWIIVFSVIGAFLLGLCIWILWKFKKSLKAFLWKKKDITVSDIIENRDYSSSPIKVLVGDQVDTPDLPIFSFDSVASATGDFAEENKLGQGGFGTVYKGNFSEGREIAVKRLSGKSKQGLEEFKNEILLIAKLQHRNLVRLLGCCIEDNEKMLLYEYMPNKSLDRFLFDESKQGSLDWRKRWEVIGGIARGLLYLHRDSRLKIIHRDLKASNILLDTEMNPKISDFGMARIFNYRQDHANTIRVVGTYGYMAPEYAMEGIFSEKSDVYSFGVLILEIVSGRKNVSFRGTDHGSLIGYVRLFSLTINFQV